MAPLLENKLPSMDAGIMAKFWASKNMNKKIGPKVKEANFSEELNLQPSPSLFE